MCWDRICFYTHVDCHSPSHVYIYPGAAFDCNRYGHQYTCAHSYPSTRSYANTGANTHAYIRPGTLTHHDAHPNSSSDSYANAYLHSSTNPYPASDRYWRTIVIIGTASG